jgi:hypothetical protein
MLPEDARARVYTGRTNTYPPCKQRAGRVWRWQGQGGGGANIFSPRAAAGQLKLFKTDFWL